MQTRDSSDAADGGKPLPEGPESAAQASSARIAVVLNGNAKSVTDEVIATLDQLVAGGDLFVSRRIEEAADIARTVIDRGYDTVLTGGGDGTFTVMVTAVVREAEVAGRSQRHVEAPASHLSNSKSPRLAGPIASESCSRKVYFVQKYTPASRSG